MPKICIDIALVPALVRCLRKYIHLKYLQKRHHLSGLRFFWDPNAEPMSLEQYLDTCLNITKKNIKLFAKIHEIPLAQEENPSHS